ncbi:MAG: DUF192 domain-containing protein [Candidatus Beckwithbacteria bacterium]
MKKWLFGLGLVILVGMVLGRELTVGKVKLAVEVRDTEAERSQGLSGREKLGEDEGMLFVFESPGIHGFWMKEMKFDLDFVWILDDRVVEVTEKVAAPKAGEEPINIKPSQPVNKVLEVNSGFAARHKIMVGDEVK